MPFWGEIAFPNGIKVFLWENVEVNNPDSMSEASLERLRGFKSESQKQGFLAVRCLLEHQGYTDFDLEYNLQGKPKLKDGMPISISHSGDFAAICLADAGVDIEKVSSRVLKAKSHFTQDEIIDSSVEQEMLTVIWGVKEAIFKISDSRNLNFRTDLHVRPFLMKDGCGTAFSTFNGWEKSFEFYFERVEDYILVVCRIC